MTEVKGVPVSVALALPRASGWLRRAWMTLLAAFLAAPGAAAGQGSLAVVDSVAHLGTLARELMVVEHPSGALFVSGYAAGMDPMDVPNLWRSDDGGASWSRVDVGTAEDGAAGNSCVDLAIGPDGTIYFLVMGFDREAGEGTHITIGVSGDEGATWTWTFLSRDRFDDRPWVDVGPSGRVHVIWNDGSGVSHAASSDGGFSWVEMEKVHPLGGSSHLAVGPADEVAVRVTPFSASGNRLDPEAEFIAVSDNAGLAWTKHDPPGDLTWTGTFDPNLLIRWVEPLAWDASGALYHMWSEGRELKLARSPDRGETWVTWTVASDPDRIMFPFLAGGAEGEIAATWYSGRGDRLRGNVARITIPPGDGAEPIAMRAGPIAVNAWSEETGQRDTGGEYIPVAILSDGSLGVATTVQNPMTDEWGFVWWRLERR